MKENKCITLDIETAKQIIESAHLTIETAPKTEQSENLEELITELDKKLVHHIKRYNVTIPNVEEQYLPSVKEIIRKHAYGYEVEELKEDKLTQVDLLENFKSLVIGMIDKQIELLDNGCYNRIFKRDTSTRLDYLKYDIMGIRIKDVK